MRGRQSPARGSGRESAHRQSNASERRYRSRQFLQRGEAALDPPLYLVIRTAVGIDPEDVLLLECHQFPEGQGHVEEVVADAPNEAASGLPHNGYPNRSVCPSGSSIAIFALVPTLSARSSSTDGTSNVVGYLKCLSCASTSSRKASRWLVSRTYLAGRLSVRWLRPSNFYVLLGPTRILQPRSYGLPFDVSPKRDRAPRPATRRTPIKTATIVATSGRILLFSGIGGSWGGGASGLSTRAS